MLGPGHRRWQTPPVADDKQRPADQRSLEPRQIAAIVLVVLMFIFVVENTRDVKIRFIIPAVTAPLWVALLVTVVIGIVAGWLIRGRRTKK